MLGYLADLIKIVSYGNEYLHHGGNYDWRTLGLLCNPMFKDGEIGSDAILARGIDGWYEYLKESGCKKIRVFYKELENIYTDINGVYYGGVFISQSVEWVIETVYEGYSDYWKSKWFGESGWKGDYYRTSCNQPVIGKHKDMEKVRENLEDKLNTISTFAYENDLGHSEYFKSNIKILNSRVEPPNAECSLIVEKNYEELARRVFHAAAASWCFNGMGSWVDGTYSTLPEVNRQSDKLTRELFLAVCDAYMYSVNSYG